MESWQHIINTAMLGTDKKQLAKEQFGGDLAAIYDTIDKTDKEDAFLQLSAVAFNYRQCGFLSAQVNDLPLSEAAEEEKPYASKAAHNTLRDILEAESTPLLHYWLESCHKGFQIIQPAWLPAIFNECNRHKYLRPAALLCCGKRGEWLHALNPEWNFDETTDEENLWQTGSLEQRKQVLRTIRQQDAGKAREMLQEVWPQENAAARTELLQQLAVNASQEDVPWLETLLQDKSTKVKEAATSLLKTIPASSLVQLLMQLLKQAITLVTSRGILGIGSKQSFEVKTIADQESLKKAGIQTLSGNKNISDDYYILQQLIEQVPPFFWEQQFQLNAEQTIGMFAKQNAQKIFIPALANAAVTFKNLEWLRAAINANDELFIREALHLLPQAEAEKYALKFLDKNEAAESVFSHLYLFHDEWSHAFALAIIKKAALNPYQYNRQFYNNIIRLIPVRIEWDLPNIKTSQEYLESNWNKLSQHLKQLLHLKNQVHQIFKS